MLVSLFKPSKTLRDIVEARKKNGLDGPAPVKNDSCDDFFDELFELAVPVTFDEGWKGGTDYLDDAVYWEPTKDQLAKGAVFKTTDDANRRVLLIPVAQGRAGTVAVYERYTPAVGEHNVYVFSAPRWADSMVGGVLGVTLDEDGLRFLFGNVGLVDGYVRAANSIADRFKAIRAVKLSAKKDSAPTSH